MRRQQPPSQYALPPPAPHHPVQIPRPLRVEVGHAALQHPGQYEQLGVIYPTRSAVIVSFALGILLLKEHLHPTKALAVIDLLTAVFLLA
jgi:hypothetical protein